MRTKFGDEFHVPKQENKSMETWVRKSSLSELHPGEFSDQLNADFIFVGYYLSLMTAIRVSTSGAYI
jgi:hypothetical protein